MALNLKELDYILKISELRNITRAAVELHITQPALSRCVRDAEEDLGAKIFDRSTNPISLTLAGEKYIRTAKRILLEHENLHKEIRDLNNHVTGRLRIGTSRDRASFMMPKLLPEFLKKYPGIETDIFTESGQKLCEALKDGKIDILILPETELEEEFNFESRLIYSEEIVLAARAGTVRSFVTITHFDLESDATYQTKTITHEALKNMKFFMLFQEHAIRQFCDKYFARHRIKPKILMQFPSNITCYRMAATGMGAAIVPMLTTLMSDSGDNVEIFSLGEEPVTWEVKAFFRKGAYIGEPEQELIRIAGEIFA